jgi:putative ABC transport system permease protein
MFKNYFKIAVRNLMRNKGFSAINIFGLALGIATCLLIMLYVQNELGYDRYNEKADRIVRVVFRSKMQGSNMNESNVMPPVAQAFKNDFPEVQEATRIRANGYHRVSYGNKLFKDDALAFVDSNFFSVFTLPLIRGDAKTALLQPYTVVISKSVAQKYFGNGNPIGKVLVFKDDKASLTVTGEIDEVPVNSHFHFGMFASMASLPEARTGSWLESNFYTYLVLPKGYNYKQLEAKMPNAVAKYIGPQLQKAMGVTFAQFKQQGNDISFGLQPLTDIHLHSDFTGDMEPYGDINNVYIFSVLAVFMLLIACINFMNLSTASASKRAREVGIRKVMGSLKGQLVRQFLLESLLLTAVALVLAIGIVYWALPLFNALTGQSLSLHLGANVWVLPGLVLFGLFTGVLAGSYPAFFLSSFNPIAVLKGKLTNGKKSSGLRSGLVVFQFFISISLIIGTTVVYNQLSYIQHKALGYDKSQVIVVDETYWLGKNENAFKQQLLQDPRVENVSISSYIPAGNSYGNNFFIYPDQNTTQIIKGLRYDVDYNYIPTLGMQIIQGRNFSKEYGGDSTAAIVNEAAVKSLGWGNNPLGHTISNNQNSGTVNAYHVIGVVKDFHFRSLHELITPLVMVMGTEHSNMLVKIKGKDIAGTLASMKKKWDGLTAESPFSYSFLDDRFNDTYKAEQNIGRILFIFAGLTIFVACLGLFGLATFTAEQRTKEIGIRKVLGANVTGLVSLLSKDFLKLVLIAFVIASPVAWYVMNKWLLDFAYRINITWQVFALAGVIVVVITLITVSYQSIKAALMNPVKSLKVE